MNERELIKEIREQIFKTAKDSESLETMHWYMWLDDCFENDEFYISQAENARWRIWVLMERGEHVTYLLELLTGLLTMHGCIVDGKWHDRPISLTGWEQEDE